MSVARADEDVPPAVLLTFSAELRSAVRTEFQRIIAVLLPQWGDAVEVSEPERWLRLRHRIGAACRRMRGTACSRIGCRTVNAEAEGIANAAMQREAAGSLRTDRSEDPSARQSTCRTGCAVRADDICGAFVPPTGDLFGAAAHGPDWQSLSAPLDRLAAFTADADNSPARRREANSVIELFQRRGRSVQHAHIVCRQLYV